MDSLAILYAQPFQQLHASPEVALPNLYIKLCGAARNYHDIFLHLEQARLLR